MRKNFFKKINGFTLVETVVAISIFSVLIFGVVMLFQMIFMGSKQQLLALDNIDSARITAGRFANEIRSAVPGVDGSATISLAGDEEIIFYSPDKFNPLLIDRIRYFIDGDDLKKSVVVPAGSPLAYNLASEKITMVQPDLALGGNPLFYYYDGNYAGSTSPLSQPVNINNVRFVRINLVVLKQTEANSENVFSFSVGAAVRSLKDNLGD